VRSAPSDPRFFRERAHEFQFHRSRAAPRERPAQRHGQCLARFSDGRRPAGQLGSPRGADGHGGDGRGALARPPAPQSRQSAVARSRPFRPVERPCVDAVVRAAPPERVRPADGRAQALPSVAQLDARSPRARPHPRRGNHDRPVGTGHHQCGGHGTRRKAHGRRVQPAGPHHRGSSHLRVSRRRLPDGRHQPRGMRTGRRVEAEQADRALRRQRHLDRRPGEGLVRRRHTRALPGPLWAWRSTRPGIAQTVRR
jgi:hypothetical protein